jgi:hypothetical protein
MNMHRLTKPEPYYRVRWQHTGLWAVAHRVPGSTDLWSIDVECGSAKAAEQEAAHMNREREKREQDEQRQRELLGLRWGRLA